MAELVPPDQTDRRAAWARAHPTAPPLPLPRELELAATKVVFFANVTPDSMIRFLATPKSWHAAVTADPAYASSALEDLLAHAHGAGRTVHPWCDCRQPDGDPPGTPFSVAVAMAERYALAEPIGQCESPAEYDAAIAAGARILIGNPNGLTAAQRSDATARIARGELAMIGEMYRPDAGYSAQGVPIASVCYGVALDADAYVPVSDYLAASSPGQRETFCVYHAAGLRPADWQLLV